ncbi:MAG: hypothetical protein FWC80_02160 [Firmicutes bacterium]|nr:hypothetical protein [Bacillota bacterium]
MATARMCKLKIVGELGDQKAILNLLTQSGCFEVAEADKAVPETHKDIEIDALKLKQSKVIFAIDYLNTLRSEAIGLNKEARKAKTKKLFDISKTRILLSKLNLDKEEYDTILKAETELLSVCGELEKNNLERLEISSKINAINDSIIQLELYKSVNLPFSYFADTKIAGVFIAYGPVGVDKNSFAKKLDCYIEEYLSEENSLWGIVCKKEDKQAVVRKLNSLGFVISTLTYDKTAGELIEKNLAQIKELEQLSYDKIREGLAYQSRLIELKALHDIFEFDIEHIAAEPYIYKTDTSVTIEGWAPEFAVASIKSKLQEKISGICIESRCVELGDEPPSMLVNTKIVRPFESVTKDYSAPTYRETDPSMVMSFFFFIFFGIMLADAGYGLIMAVAGLLIGIFVKFEKPLRRMILMFGICGISGIIFGLLFGGFFAIEGLPPLWFNPLDDPITMLVFSLTLGAIHLLVGYTLKSIGTIRVGLAPSLSKRVKLLRIFDGLFESIFMYALFGGILFLLLPIVFSHNNFPFIPVSIALLVTAITGILLTSGRRSPSLSGKIIGGFGGLYRLINVFSDVLSYARLFGLALASGAIAMAFNQIGLLVVGVPIVGYVLGVIALIILHAFNFALSALAAYVHNIRLQYVEFFGKFYDGNGRFFAPLGENTKYVRFVE